ncbi:uncharacterized protein LOC134281736 [Saccostrea cucullata]|uniref:uncharacterized protein LOC134281736 n=1 Tax=Saccostrea cuccullata TaxID=36930 RepID=UPI002ED5B070
MVISQLREIRQIARIRSSRTPTCPMNLWSKMASNNSKSTFGLETEKYQEQLKRWPKEGRHILAQYDDNTIIVYQAFRKEIAEYADKNGKFGGPLYSFNRMTWIKTNFLWMMYRSGWAEKSNQDRILAIRLTIDGFLEILRVSQDASKDAYGPGGPQVGFGDGGVRLQWDPDHTPHGNKCTRRAVQLGLKGEILEKFNEQWIRNIYDITDFVKEQRQFVLKNDLDSLMTPRETVFVPNNPNLCRHIRLDVDNTEDKSEEPT